MKEPGDNKRLRIKMRLNTIHTDRKANYTLACFSFTFSLRFLYLPRTNYVVYLFHAYFLTSFSIRVLIINCGVSGTPVVYFVILTNCLLEEQIKFDSVHKLVLKNIAASTE